MTNPTDTLPARRIRDLDAGQWLLLAETFATLAAASAAIALLPFRRVVALAARDRPGKRNGRSGVNELVWAVEAVAWRVPWRTVCFQKGLALHLMLRRRGVASVLHYGVRTDESGKLAAHVWIAVGGRCVMGGDVADQFSCLATYPAGS